MNSTANKITPCANAKTSKTMNFKLLKNASNILNILKSMQS